MNAFKIFSTVNTLPPSVTSAVPPQRFVQESGESVYKLGWPEMQLYYPPSLPPPKSHLSAKIQ